MGCHEREGAQVTDLSPGLPRDPRHDPVLREEVIAALAIAPGERHVDVVLVPTDAGLNLGFVFEPGDGAWVAVFIPGAPDWRSGAVAFVERTTMQPAGIEFIAAIKLLRKLGSGAQPVLATLERGAA